MEHLMYKDHSIFNINFPLYNTNLIHIIFNPVSLPRQAVEVAPI